MIPAACVMPCVWGLTSNPDGVSGFGLASIKIDKSTEMRQRWGKKEEEEKKAWSRGLGGEI